MLLSEPEIQLKLRVANVNHAGLRLLFWFEFLVPLTDVFVFLNNLAGLTMRHLILLESSRESYHYFPYLSRGVLLIICVTFSLSAATLSFISVRICKPGMIKVSTFSYTPLATVFSRFP